MLLWLFLMFACTSDHSGVDAAINPRDGAVGARDGSLADASPGRDADEDDAAPLDQDATPGMDATPPGMDASADLDAMPPAPMDAAAMDASGPINPTMGFFVTSQGNGAVGGNYGGLAGADDRCQLLATAVGAGARTWRAYLSTSGSGPNVDARDRIGNGPWTNAMGVEIAVDVNALHANGIPSAAMLTELGGTVPSNEHDILTGTMPDGTAWDEFPGNPSAPPPNCFNWTSNQSDAYTYVGHADWDLGSGTWNSAHDTTCDASGLMSTAGSGRLYCFASD